MVISNAVWDEFDEKLINKRVGVVSELAEHLDLFFFLLRCLFVS